jgi:hypothetical protein
MIATKTHRMHKKVLLFDRGLVPLALSVPFEALRNLRAQTRFLVLEVMMEAGSEREAAGVTSDWELLFASLT